ncbi:phage holin [Staphylococcus epidermidis]|nr:phage holin [Staphylococcus epidermidis]MCG1573258.1 phage holin [Staphylococcus epidermidis]
MKTDVGSIARTIALALAWINQILAMNKISPIPVDEMTISTVITGVVSLLAWWKNNNFSHAAQKGQQKIHEVKAGTENTNGKAPIGGNDL